MAAPVRSRRAWLFAPLVLLLGVAAVLLLRKPSPTPGVVPLGDSASGRPAAAAPPAASQAGRGAGGDASGAPAVSATRPRLVARPAAITLLEKREGSKPSPHTVDTRRYDRHCTPVHLDFIVPELDAAVARLTRLGATLDRPIQLAEYGRMANMADPFGNGFDLIEFSGSGYDAVSR